MPRVLIIDDEAALRQTLERALRSMHYDVASAGDPSSALVLLAEGQFDAVLLDLRLNQTMGDAFYFALVRQWPYLRGRVILMSGDPWALADTWPAELHACPMLAKPFTLEVLARTIASVVQPDSLKQNGSA